MKEAMLLTKEIRTVLTVLMVFVLVFAAALMRDLYGGDRVLLLIAAAVMVCVHNVSECGVERVGSDHDAIFRYENCLTGQKT